MALKKSQLYSSIWQSCDELRGGMDASQYKDYVLTLLFMKYVSDKYAGKPDALIKLPAGDVKSCVRCVAGKGIKGLRWSVGYLQVRDNELLFVTRRSFRFRNHQIDRQTIEDVNIKKRILLDRLILRADGKQHVFSLFKYPPHSDNLLRLLDSHRKTR